jgi:hypothetical protein
LVDNQSTLSNVFFSHDFEDLLLEVLSHHQLLI